MVQRDGRGNSAKRDGDNNARTERDAEVRGYLGTETERTARARRTRCRYDSVARLICVVMALAPHSDLGKVWPISGQCSVAVWASFGGLFRAGPGRQVLARVGLTFV